MTEGEEPAFGALAPTAAQGIARRVAARVPYTRIGRKLASLLLGPAGGRSGAAFDVAVFGSQRARLYPADNICEKRVYLTPRHWDPKERAALATAIRATTAADFVFVDVGANVGLYTLFARSIALAAGRRFRGVCVEPDPEMQRRLRFNLSSSGASEDVSVYPYAATAQDGEVRLAVNTRSRGMSRLAADGSMRVAGRPLVGIAAEAGLPRIDALKIDIEGHEHAVLAAFFAAAEPAILPKLIILETSHETRGESARALVLSSGYRGVLDTALNTVVQRT